MATKGRPFTIRLSRGMEDWIEREARRSKRTKGAMLLALAEEGIRMRRFPGIAFRGPEHDRRAWVAGTGLDVWELIELHRGKGEKRLFEEHQVSERQLELALAYYGEHPEEIDAAVEENSHPLSYWRERYPGLKIEGVPLEE